MLSYLKKLQITKIKIDQSFIRDIYIDDDDKAIVRAIIAISKSLGLAIIVEGIETEDQKNFLKLEGCNLGQGYLFSKPIIADEFEKLLIKQKKEWKNKKRPYSWSFLFYLIFKNTIMWQIHFFVYNLYLNKKYIFSYN